MRANMPALAAGRRHSAGRRWDGTVIAVGSSAAGECRVGRWEDVVAVAAGSVHTAANTGRSHTVGLRSDGTVLATGWNGDGQRDVAAWRDVTAVAAGWRRTLGLLADGTVLAAGRRSEGQCDVQSWREVVALSCGDWHSAGARADGSALAAGNNRRGTCAVGDWQGIVAVAAGSRSPLACALTVRSPAQGTMPAVSATPTPDREFKLQAPEPEQRDRKPGRAWGYIAGSAGSPLLTGSCPVSPVQPGFGVLPPQHRGLLARCHVPVAVQHRHREGFACAALSMLAADAVFIFARGKLVGATRC
jgi:hypothetical protein